LGAAGWLFRSDPMQRGFDHVFSDPTLEFLGRANSTIFA
jgi:hypothetical protein